MVYFALLLIVATFAAVMFVTTRDVVRGLIATLPATIGGVGAAIATQASQSALAVIVAVAGGIAAIVVLSMRQQRPIPIYVLQGGQRTDRARRTTPPQRFVVLSGGRSERAR